MKILVPGVGDLPVLLASKAGDPQTTQIMATSLSSPQEWDEWQDSSAKHLGYGDRLSQAGTEEKASSSSLQQDSLHSASSCYADRWREN